MSSLETTSGPARERVLGPVQRPDAVLRLGIAAFALYFWVVAALMVLAPGFFFAHIGPFGVRNDHYIRDTATFNVALGVGLAIAYWRPSWRVPLLCCVTVQFALHALNHLADIDASHPHWLGPADFVSLAMSALLLAGLLRQALRARPSGPNPSGGS